MNENNIFILSENQSNKGNPKNITGHNAAMAAGGLGHYDGDECGIVVPDTNEPQQNPVPIDGWVPFLFIAGLVLITLKISKK